MITFSLQGSSGKDTRRMEETEAANQENEVNDLVNDIMRSISEKLEPLLTSKSCIYRVPSKFREVNKKAYTPLVVSIGPFHNGDSRLKAKENLKLRYLESSLQRYYIGFVKEKEDDVRRCYAETIQRSSDSFVKVILLMQASLLSYSLGNAFYDKHWHRRKAILRLHYFCTPWKTTSSIAAIITLLVLTLIQSVCSVLS
ncbi:hypothetical protein L6164_033203 [Bauhinia variegata]|uniref:Uncharacterized protein n=1 Tax=Bauhinia variegata TaxID=167791 RepID=A0ACB9KR55_BAUVA|nr:hypothetical protein L6164_033203 [Bauhinia variegata]